MNEMNLFITRDFVKTKKPLTDEISILVNVTNWKSQNAFVLYSGVFYRFIHSKHRRTSLGKMCTATDVPKGFG